MGYYKISYNDIWYLGSGKPTVHIYTKGEAVRVIGDGTYEKKYEFDGSSGDWIYSYTFSPTNDGDLGEAMMIFQGAKNFADYAKTMNDNKYLDFCDFKYPVEGDICYYNGNNVVSIIREKPFSSWLPKSYAAWDIIGHEYGHHVQKCFGLSKSPGGEHYFDTNSIDVQFERLQNLEKAKRNGLRLAWSEAWPTYWSTVAQSHFSDDLKSIKTVGDSGYSASNNVEYDLDGYFPWTKGDADEIAIQRVLYKIYSPEKDDYDQFAFGEYRLWEIILQNKPSTFYEFMNILYDSGFDKNALGQLLDQNGILDSDIYITNNNIDTCPTFEWSTAKGSENLYFNEFDLFFSTVSGMVVKEIKNIKASGKTCSYTLSNDDWKSICGYMGSEFNVYFRARQTDFFISANYFSEKITFEAPSKVSENKIHIKPYEWGFEGRYYFSNEIENNDEYRYSTFNKGELTISTDRLRCGYIEDSYINLSPRRENAGRAYFEMNFDKPIYSFLYSIRLWSELEELDGIAVLQIKDSDGKWSILTDLNSNEINLSTRLKRYSFYSENGIYGLKFEATSTATGDRNKGRISLDDIVFSTIPGKNNNLYFYTDYPKTTR